MKRPGFWSVLIEALQICIGQGRNEWCKYLACKCFHSHEGQDPITFNSPQISKTHPSTTLLKFLLTPELLLSLFNSSPNKHQK